MELEQLALEVWSYLALEQDLSEQHHRCLAKVKGKAVPATVMLEAFPQRHLEAPLSIDAQSLHLQVSVRFRSAQGPPVRCEDGHVGGCTVQVSLDGMFSGINELPTSKDECIMVTISPPLCLYGLIIVT